jgi:hypothetical protein
MTNDKCKVYTYEYLLDQADDYKFNLKYFLFKNIKYFGMQTQSVFDNVRFWLVLHAIHLLWSVDRHSAHVIIQLMHNWEGLFASSPYL